MAHVNAPTPARSDSLSSKGSIAPQPPTTPQRGTGHSPSTPAARDTFTRSGDTGKTLPGLPPNAAQATATPATAAATPPAVKGPGLLSSIAVVAAAVGIGGLAAAGAYFLGTMAIGAVGGPVGIGFAAGLGACALLAIVGAGVIYFAWQKHKQAKARHAAEALAAAPPQAPAPAAAPPQAPAPAATQQHEAPAQQHEAPVQQHEAPAQQHEAPVQQQAPAQQHEAPVQQHEAPVQQHEAPVQQQAPAQQHEAPVQQHEAPVQQHEAPVQQHEAPVQQHEAPVQQQAPAPQEQSQNPPPPAVPRT